MLSNVNVCNIYMLLVMAPQYNILCLPTLSAWSKQINVGKDDGSRSITDDGLQKPKHAHWVIWMADIIRVSCIIDISVKLSFFCLSFLKLFDQGIKRQGSSCGLPFCHPCLLDPWSLLAFYRQPPWGRCFRMCFPLLTRRIFGSEICQRKDLKENKLFVSSFAELLLLT